MLLVLLPVVLLFRATSADACCSAESPCLSVQSVAVQCSGPGQSVASIVRLAGSSVTSLEGFPPFLEIRAEFTINGTSLRNFSGAGRLLLTGTFRVINNPLLQNLEGGQLVGSRDSQVYVGNNTALTRLTTFESDGSGNCRLGTLWIDHNPSMLDVSGAESLTFLNTLRIQNMARLTTLAAFANLKQIETVTVMNNPSLTSLRGPFPPNVYFGAKTVTIANNTALRDLQGVVLMKPLQRLALQSNGLRNMMFLTAWDDPPLSPPKLDIQEPNLCCPPFAYYSWLRANASSFRCRDCVTILAPVPAVVPVTGGLTLTLSYNGALRSQRISLYFGDLPTPQTFSVETNPNRVRGTVPPLPSPATILVRAYFPADQVPDSALLGQWNLTILSESSYFGFDIELPSNRTQSVSTTPTLPGEISPESSERADEIAGFVALAGVLTSIVLVLAYLVLFRLGICDLNWAKLDLLVPIRQQCSFAAGHSHGRKQLIAEATDLGGLMTVLTSAAILIVSSAFLAQTLVVRDESTTGLVPGLEVVTPLQTDLAANITVVTANGAGATVLCSTDASCVAWLRVSGFTEGQQAIRCSRPLAGMQDRCSVLWQCAGCKTSGRASPSLVLNSTDVNAWAVHYYYAVSTTVHDGSPSVVQGHVAADSQRIFRGSPFPRVHLGLVRSRFTYHTDDPLEGVVTKFNTMTSGNTVNSTTFGTAQFAGLEIDLDVNPAVLAVTVSPKQSGLAIAAQLFSLVLGILSGSRWLLVVLLNCRDRKASQVKSQQESLDIPLLTRDHAPAPE